MKPKNAVQKGQIWVSTDKRRGYRIKVLSVKNGFAWVESVDKSKGGTAMAKRMVKLSRFTPHSGLKLDTAAALTKDTETLDLPEVPPETLKEFAELPPVNLATAVTSPTSPVMTMPAPPDAKTNIHEEVTAEHPILR